MIENPKGQISHDEYGQFCLDFQKQKKIVDDIRYGQAFIVYFNEKLKLPWPELYYETDAKKAKELIFQNIEFID